MARLVAAVCGIPLFASMSVAATYTVTNDNDSGMGSLRWAIGRANTHAGGDTIAFAQWVGGSIIQPLTPLPAITDDGTIVDGDLNDDGLPDIGVDGNRVDLGDDDQLLSAFGLRVLQADDCRIEGLVLTRWYQAGIWLEGSSRSKVTTCHVGVNRAGTRAWSNGNEDIGLTDCSACVIGGASALARNVLAAGWGSEPPGDHGGSGVLIRGGAGNRIIGNYIGIRRDGSGALGNGHFGDTGVFIIGGANHRIGGAAAGAGNVIGGLYTGVVLTGGARGTLIAGNLIGLAADGDTLAPVEASCISLSDTSTRTAIGGTTAGARNVFAGGAYRAIYVNARADGRVVIQGNYFGTNATGTAHRGQSRMGVDEGSTGDEVTIGGGTAAAGNFFDVAGGIGVQVRRTSDSTIRNNVFGVFPNGQNANAMLDAVLVTGESSPVIRDNEFANALGAVVISGSGAGPGIFGNRFHHCAHAVYVMDGASCRLGDLGNARTNDDGGNVFRRSNTWHIYNSTANDIRAEGNRFGTRSYAEISAKIHDQVDNGSLGLVDFDPLFGGVSPTGRAGGGTSLAVSGMSARQTATGAEVIFTLSAAASVQARVLNIAGRPVATVCSGRDCAVGANRLLWDAMTDEGLAVPNGTYLIEVAAAAPDGTRFRALAQVHIRR